MIKGPSHSESAERRRGMDILKTAMELPRIVAEANEGVPERTVLLIIVEEMQRLYEISKEVNDNDQ